MTIRRGEPWGEPAVCPPEVSVVSGDRGLRHWVLQHRARGASIPDVGVAGGDLARTCGAVGSVRPHTAKVTVDALRVMLDDREPTCCVAHVVARRDWLRGEVVLVMNAQYYGRYDVAPRSHPNDGKFDVLRVDPAMRWRERLQARQRARPGAHLPHRDLAFRSLSELDLQFDRPLIVWIDGVRQGAASRLRVVAEPDALTIYV
jgi:diacylglycerol kinase family enzyme